MRYATVQMESLDALFGLLGKAGPMGPVLGVMCWLFWAANSERKDLTKQLLDLSTKSIAAETAMSHSLEILTAKLKV